jgi:hypothetical protein
MRILVTTAVALLVAACGGAVREAPAETMQGQASAPSAAGEQDKACGEPLKGPSWGTTLIDIKDVQTTGFVHNLFTGPAILSGLGLSRVVFPHDLFYPTKAVTGHITITAANGDELKADVVGSALPDPGVPGGSLLDQTGTITGGTGRFADAEGSFKILGKVAGPVPGTNPFLRDVRVTINGYFERNRDCD